MEKHLEEFLVENWGETDLGMRYDILEVDGERVGQQYPTDTGPIDILAVSKDRTCLLVVELKKGRANDRVVGQTLRYMGYVRDELAEESQTVEGAIIAPDDDLGLRRALSLVPSVAFYRYEVNFRLIAA
jgi:restriction system protein